MDTNSPDAARLVGYRHGDQSGTWTTQNTLNEMLEQWPYFQTLIDMLEMVLSKSDADIALYYESHLTQDQDLKNLGLNYANAYKMP